MAASPAMRRRRAAGEPQWFFRRLVAIGAMAFSGWRLVMLESAPDTRVNETLAFGWHVLFAAVVTPLAGAAAIRNAQG